MMTKHQNVEGRERRGIVLLAVLVIVVLLSLAAYQYSDLMLAEYKASVNAHEAAQARAFADSGIHYVAALISSPESIAGINGNLFDNPEAFRNVSIGGDEARGTSGRFSLIAPSDPDDAASTTARAGVVDEGGKINVNAFMKRDPKGQLLYDALLKLPNMTDEIAASIVDWLDPDSEPRQGGAENDYYGGESPSYRAKNGPIDSLGELLLVKGVDRGVLYGNDLNGNGIQDPDEAAETEGFSRGLSAYLTVYSREQNSDPKTGEALTYINDSDLALFYEKLSPTLGEDLAKFVIMYRQYGPSKADDQQKSKGKSQDSQSGDSKAGDSKSGDSKSGDSKSGGGKSKGKTRGKSGKGGKSSSEPTTVQGNISSWSPDFTNPKPATKITSLFDLANTQVSIPSKDPKGPTTIYQSPLNDTGQRRDLFAKLFENTTIFEESEIPARVNVNTAAREVLAAIPDLSEADVEAIMSLRPKASASEPPSAIFETPAWLLTEAHLKAENLKKIEKNITTKSQVYYVQAVGYFDGAGPTARVEAVIDINAGRPRIIMWRDLSELGSRGMKSDQ
jgi:type II secretory pathway component PulK